MLELLFAGVTAIATGVTAFSVWFARRQISAMEAHVELSRQQSRTAFEDDLSREYRSIVAGLPPQAFYVDADPRAAGPDVRGVFYRYFDLCNEQLFLCRLGRISEATAQQWKEGIVGNLGLPAFQAAWHHLEPRLPPSFFTDPAGMYR